MLTFLSELQVRVWLHPAATNMRKCFDGLAALARDALVQTPTSGHLFVFINPRRTQMKVLYFDPESWGQQP